MNRRHARGAVGVAAGIVLVAVCTVGARVLRSDPIMVMETVAGVALVVWAARLALDLRRAHHLSRELASRGSAVSIDGVACCLVPGLQAQAFVAGVLHPTIYVGPALLDVLDPDERRAVLLHEEHHRRTFAPLRGASLNAWLGILGSLGAVRRALVDRQADLERRADAFAMANGVRAATLASALLKVDVLGGSVAAAFSSAADRRIESLLRAAAGEPRAHTDRLPYEWLPPIAVAFVAIACHLIAASNPWVADAVGRVASALAS